MLVFRPIYSEVLNRYLEKYILILMQVPAKSSEEKLKEQAKKMKFFAKELQGMPEFTAVIKVISFQ